MSAASLPYHEPSIEQILVQTSFLLLLHVTNWALDRLVYCGLVGQILVGVAWGAPALKLLSVEWQNTFVQLGYLGLILLVFEGGLSTSLPAVRANVWRSASVAATGIGAPIALSFLLKPMTGATYLECFAAGAALCSTSLGTTFTVLRSCGLSTTRLGVVLTSAAMLDDVVGLVMVQVISNLGSANGEETSFSAVTIIRPVLVSIAFAVVSFVVCRWVVKPLRGVVNNASWAQPRTTVGDILHRRHTKLVCATALLVGLVTGASYAGTSNLFAAYIAGVVLSWWDDDRPAMEGQSHCSTVSIFEEYYQPALRWILTPYFFASVGFSIPITRMFSGPIVWKGIVYGVLMGLAKVVCGAWLLRVPTFGLADKIKSRLASSKLRLLGQKIKGKTCQDKAERKDEKKEKGEKKKKSETTKSSGQTTSGVVVDASGPAAPAEQTSSPSPTSTPSSTRHASPAPTPFSLYPAAILGLAMVPRGEIGFLISAVASTNGVFEKERGDSAQSDVFLIVTWAIVLCTMVGPLSVGLLVRRVKRLSAGQDESSRHPLGVWGVQG